MTVLSNRVFIKEANYLLLKAVVAADQQLILALVWSGTIVIGQIRTCIYFTTDDIICGGR